MAAAPDDVVAFLPTTLIASPIWGHAEESRIFPVTAMTGLDGYFSSEMYSRFHAVPGLRGRDTAQVLTEAQDLYAQRRGDIESFLRGDITKATSARLARDQVRWIVVLDASVQGATPSATAWRKNRWMLSITTATSGRLRCRYYRKSESPVIFPACVFAQIRSGRRHNSRPGFLVPWGPPTIARHFSGG